MRHRKTIEKKVVDSSLELRDLLRNCNNYPKYGYRRQLIDKKIVSLTAEITALKWVLNAEVKNLLSEDIVDEEE